MRRDLGEERHAWTAKFVWSFPALCITTAGYGIRPRNFDGFYYFLIVRELLWILGRPVVMPITLNAGTSRAGNFGIIKASVGSPKDKNPQVCDGCHPHLRLNGWKPPGRSAFQRDLLSNMFVVLLSFRLAGLTKFIESCSNLWCLLLCSSLTRDITTSLHVILLN